MRYRRLVNALVDIAARQRDGGDMLAAQHESLQVVLAFLNADPDLATAILPGPLVALHGALHDRQVRRRTGRPTDTRRAFRRGHLAAALDLLITHGGMRPGVAAQWVQAECRRAGVTEIVGQPLAAHHLLRWRNDVIGRVAPAAMASAFVTLAAGYKRRPMTREDAQASALIIIENLRRLISPETSAHTGEG